MTKKDILSSITFGKRVAEEESNELVNYFVETDLWTQLFSDQKDIVYGPKGSGKSALYALLLARIGELFDRYTILIPAENPRGATAFKDLTTDPPTTERELIGLWKLYFTSLIARVFDEYGMRSEAASKLKQSLAQEGLIPREWSIKTQLKAVFDYVRRFFRPKSIEAGVEIDPSTGLPKGFKGKITFEEPSESLTEKGIRSVDSLLEYANSALVESKFNVWIILDRLDVAFTEDPKLEHNALRALFRVYLDMLAFGNIRLKVFLRSDIWRKITTDGFREASHITRYITITWDRGTLLNLVTKRAVQNKQIQEFYEVTYESALASSESQEEFFYRMFPNQVDVGPKNPGTFDWILGRTKDGTKQNAPREVIHLLNSLREVQMRRLEVGEPEPENELLFSRVVFKEALSEVSRARLEQTLYSEYPSLRGYLENLRGEKTGHTIKSLSKIWNVTTVEATNIAQQLVEVGFFEQRGVKDDPEFWVPFLYRDSLELVQGSA